MAALVAVAAATIQTVWCIRVVPVSLDKALGAAQGFIAPALTRAVAAVAALGVLVKTNPAHLPLETLSELVTVALV
jgi:hypothetical protein